MSNIRSQSNNPVETEEQKKEKAEAKKTEEIQLLVNYLHTTTKNVTAGTRPVKELGYSQREKNPAGIVIREDLIKAQQELTSLKNSELKGKDLSAIEQSYAKLHKTQGEYIDGLLQGKEVELKKFKEEQAELIKDCNKNLEQLLKDNKDNKEIDASVAKQKKLLEDLPSKITKTQEELIKSLKNQKQNYIYDSYDKKVNGERENIEGAMFSVYLGRDPEAEKKMKEDLDKYGNVGDDAIAMAVAGADQNNNPIPKDKIRKGYKDAQKNNFR